MNLTTKIKIPEGKILYLPKGLTEKRIIDSKDEIEIWKLLVACIGNILANIYLLNISNSVINTTDADPNDIVLKDDLEQEVLEFNGNKYLTKILNRKVKKRDFQLSLNKYFKFEIEMIEKCLSILNPADAKRVEFIIFGMIFGYNQEVKDMKKKWLTDDLFEDVYLGEQYSPGAKDLVEGLKVNKLTHKFKNNYNEELKFLYDNIKYKFTTKIKDFDVSRYKKMGHTVLDIFKALNSNRDLVYMLGLKDSVAKNFKFELDNLKQEMIIGIKKTCLNVSSLNEEFFTAQESEVMRYLDIYINFHKEVKEKNEGLDIKDLQDVFSSFSDEILKLFYCSENKNYKVISGMISNYCLLVADLNEKYGNIFNPNLKKYKRFKDRLLTIDNNKIEVNEETYKMIRVILRSTSSLKEALGEEFQKEISKDFKNEKNNNINISNSVNLTLINRFSIDENALIYEYKKLSKYIKESKSYFLEDDLNKLLEGFKDKSSLGKGLTNNFLKVLEGLNINVELKNKIKEENGAYTLYHCLEFNNLKYPIEAIKEIMWDITLNNFMKLDKECDEYDEILSIYQSHLMDLDLNVSNKKLKVKKF